MSKEAEPLPELLPCRKCGKSPRKMRKRGFDPGEIMLEIFCCGVSTGEHAYKIAAYKTWNSINAP